MCPLSSFSGVQLAHIQCTAQRQSLSELAFMKSSARTDQDEQHHTLKALFELCKLIFERINKVEIQIIKNSIFVEYCGQETVA